MSRSDLGETATESGGEVTECRIRLSVGAEFDSRRDSHASDREFARHRALPQHQTAVVRCPLSLTITAIQRVTESL